MKISKEYIMALSALIAVLGAVAGGYQFYYRERLDEYQKNIATEQQLETTLIALQETFSGCEPEKLISAIKGEFVPLQDELTRRSSFFNTKDMFTIEPIPQGKMFGFYYRDEFNRIFTAFREEAMRRFPTCYYPDITFGAPRPEEFTGIAVTQREVEDALKKISFGLQIMKMLMEAKAAYITDIQIWPDRPGGDGLWTQKTVGMAFGMQAKDLVAFVDNKLRMGERFITVDGISIQNKYLRWAVEPPLEVQMLISFIQVKDENAPPEAGEADAEGAPAGGGMLTQGGQSPEELLKAWKARAKNAEFDPDDPRRKNIPTTKWGKFKRWMRKYFWPF